MKETEKIRRLTKELDNLDALLDSKEEDKVIIEHSKEASSYLLGHEWCSEITNGWIAIGWGEILGVFLYEIKGNYPEVDEFVWMIVGDIPPAYIDIESASEPEEALRSYVQIMEDWVDAVESNKSVEECYPIEVPPNREYASMLKTRLALITEELDNHDSSE